MSRPLTIVMYHYVRDLKRSRFPGIKGRDLDEFRFQLDHIERHFTVVTAEQVIDAAADGAPLPPDACWLTFDDGYLDHFTTVFPLLHERGLQGSFFPPARTILNGDLLDVNKIHFVLAAAKDVAPIVGAIRAFIGERRAAGPDLWEWDRYWATYAEANAYDTAEIIFIKRMLQKALPEDLRNELADLLFAQYVSADPAAFAAELYMSADQVKTMVRSGMYVGSHGNAHYWLDSLDREKKAEEIDCALTFLSMVGAPTERWVMCYPYGAYDAEVLELLGGRSCAVGVTTRAAVADLGRDAPLELPRVDTNELPFR